MRDLPADELDEWLKRLEVDALAVHLNPGQEYFQEHGDRDFTGVRDAILRYADRCPVPVIVKETGFGLAIEEITSLKKGGIAWFDLAGAGGTNWVLVEAARQSGPLARAAR